MQPPWWKKMVGVERLGWTAHGRFMFETRWEKWKPIDGVFAANAGIVFYIIDHCEGAMVHRRAREQNLTEAEDFHNLNNAGSPTSRWRCDPVAWSQAGFSQHAVIGQALRKCNIYNIEVYPMGFHNSGIAGLGFIDWRGRFACQLHCSDADVARNIKWKQHTRSTEWSR